jgi:cell migration-inducing and hyaluronan-binding protein
MPKQQQKLTGYGGHIIVHEGGKGYVEGVELYRMGQDQRYRVAIPCISIFLVKAAVVVTSRDSSPYIGRYYRCVSIHGTHFTQVSENVAYDVIGYCYYLEDGIEHDNRIEFNLGAHIHMIGPEPPWGTSQILVTTRKAKLSIFQQM